MTPNRERGQTLNTRAHQLLFLHRPLIAAIERIAQLIAQDIPAVAGRHRLPIHQIAGGQVPEESQSLRHVTFLPSMCKSPTSGSDTVSPGRATTRFMSCTPSASRNVTTSSAMER